MADLLASLEAEYESIRLDKGTPSSARSAASRAVLRLQRGREHYAALVGLARARARASASEARAVPRVAGDEVDAWRGPDGESVADLLSPLLLLLSHRDARACAADYSPPTQSAEELTNEQHPRP